MGSTDYADTLRRTGHTSPARPTFFYSWALASSPLQLGFDSVRRSGPTCSPFYPVTAPSDADPTSFAYFHSAPLVCSGSGGVAAAIRS